MRKFTIKRRNNTLTENKHLEYLKRKLKSKAIIVRIINNKSSLLLYDLLFF